MALVVKNPLASAGDIRNVGSIPGLGRCPGGGHGNRLQYSYLENPIDRGDWQATVHRIARSQTQLKQLSTHARIRSLYSNKIVSEAHYLERIKKLGCSGWSNWGKSP